MSVEPHSLQTVATCAPPVRCGHIAYTIRFQLPLRQLSREWRGNTCARSCARCATACAQPSLVLPRTLHGSTVYPVHRRDVRFNKQCQGSRRLAAAQSTRDSGGRQDTRAQFIVTTPETSQTYPTPTHLPRDACDLYAHPAHPASWFLPRTHMSG